jgi:hypothetical protein
VSIAVFPLKCPQRRRKRRLRATDFGGGRKRLELLREMHGPSVDPSSCPAGGIHDATGSSAYFVEFTGLQWAQADAMSVCPTRWQLPPNGWTPSRLARDHALWHYARPVGRVATAGSLGGDIAGQPPVCSWGQGRIDVFVVGTDGALYW